MKEPESKAKAALNQMFLDAFGDSEDDELMITLRQIASGEDDIELPDALMNDEGDEAEETNLYVLINEMGIPEKIKLAMFGNKAARGLLIRDSNRQVALFVLQNNRLRESEVVDFAKNTNLDEQIHRAIARNPGWLKGYEIKLGMVSNPKVPPDVSMKFIKHLHIKDLRKLSKSKNIPSAISTGCRKMAEKRGKR